MLHFLRSVNFNKLHSLRHFIRKVTTMKTKNAFLQIKKTAILLLSFCINLLHAEGNFNHLEFGSGTHKNNVPESRTAYFNQSIIGEVKKIHNDRSIVPTLAQDGTYIHSFFQIASELNLNKENVLVGTRLLNNALKQCEFIDDSVIHQIMHPLPGFLEKYFDEESKKEREQLELEQQIKNAMTINISSNLEDFIKNPEHIINKTATEIATMSFAKATEQQRALDEHDTQERLRQNVLKLIENILSKQLYNRHAPESIWPSVMKTAHDIYKLAVHKTIKDSDDLDDCYWTLTHRFCWFLDFVGSSLPVSFYKEIEEELNDGTVFFVELGEADEGIKTKKEFLTEAVAQAKVKAIAFTQHGIFTDHQPIMQ